MIKMRIAVCNSWHWMAVWLIVISMLPSCKDIPNGGIPVYIRVDSTRVEPTFVGSPYRFGSLSHRITDVWAYDGSIALGAFETPIKIPILDTGNLGMTFSPGIMDDGLTNYRVIYALMKPDTFTIVHPIPGATYYHQPRYSYFDSLQIGFIEDFEQSTTIFKGLAILHGSPSTNPYIYQGLGSGFLSVDTGYQQTVINLKDSIPIKANGREVYLEMDYNLSVLEAEIGIKTITNGVTSGQLPRIILEPNNKWTKIYINLSSLVGKNPADYYKVYINPFKPINSPRGHIAMDNMKLLYLH
jgi:hypothetical protein